jgi:tetratricopeptide (TPR) repeat protein
MALQREDPALGTPACFAGRYALGQILKRGNGVDTYLAEDLVTGAKVVLKRIDPGAIHAAARLRFEHETHVLRTLAGAGLTGLHDAGTWENQLFLVQPFLNGSSLEHLLTSGPLPLAAVLRIGVDVATALDTAHSAGVCHRDVKPANVIVDGINPLGPVSLIDFGFARSPWLDESIRDDLVGTIRYLAPEAAGLLAVPADERSDLYSLGVLLFECLTGRPPFLGPTVGDLLRQHLSSPAPQLMDVDVQAPRALNAVLQRLLRKEPAERYQSAAAVASDLQNLRQAVETGDTDPRVVIGRGDHRRSLTDPAFVGRDAELTALLTLVEQVRTGGSGLVLLEADSGGGKSRLLTELALHASGSSTGFLRGQAVAQAAQRPFTLLHSVAQDLAALAEADPVLRLSLPQRVGEAAAAVVRALPGLGPVLHITADTDAGPEQFGEQRSLDALHHLLASIATPGQPIILVLDDCQWADGLTVRLLSEMFGPGAAPPPYVGVIAAFRSEEVPADHPLRHISQAHTVALGPLPGQAMAQLAESMAGPLPERAIGTVVRLADGSPFMGAAVLRGLVECGALLGSPSGWRVDELALQDVQTARRSATFLVRRLELLSADALRVLSAGAVLGKEFDVLAAVQLSGETQGAAAIIEEARARRLLWVDERSGHCSFFHDKIREALLDRLEPTTRSLLHSRAADALLAVRSREVADVDVFDLAYHLDAAGRHDEVLPAALRAAVLARSQHGLESAVTHYRMAERGVSADDARTRAEIAEGLGDVLTLQGVYGLAKEHLTQARSLVTDRVHAAALDGKLGELAFKQGDVPTARGHLEGAMAQLGRPVPRRTSVLVVRLLWEVAVQVLHSVFPKLMTGRRSPVGRDEEFLAIRLHSRLAYLYWFHSGKLPCAWSHLRGLNLAERYPISSELAQAYSEHAPALTMVPWYGRALRYVQRSLEIRTELGDVWGQGQSLSFAGVTLYAASRYDEGVEACAEALRLLEQTGDRWEANTAGWTRAKCLHRLGTLPEAAEAAREVYVSATAIGDKTSAGVSLSVWALASGGRIDGDLIERGLTQRGEDASTATELLLAAAVYALSTQDLLGAEHHLTEAVNIMGSAGLRQEFVAPVPCWYATVQRLLCEATPAHDPSLRTRRLRRTARAVRRARFWALAYRNNAPHALREAGLLASLRGHRRRAVRLLDKSLQTAERQGARYEAALTRLAQAELSTLRVEGPSGSVDRLRAELLALESAGQTDPASASPAATVSLFDRFTTLLSVGRTLAAASSVAAVESATREAALALLRGERCHLVDVRALHDESLVSQSGEAVDSLSRTLLARAVDTGAPVVASDPTADESESLLLSGIRSALAAPIVAHGETVSCFYVTHRHIGQLFGEEEIPDVLTRDVGCGATSLY